MPNAKVISFPLPENIRLCWSCLERRALDEPWACGMCEPCARKEQGLD